MAFKSIKMKRLRWIYISPITRKDIVYLEKNFNFHPLDLKDCREGVQRPKLDIYKDYLFMIFHFPVFDKQTRRVGVKSLNIFMGNNFIITLTNNKIKFLDEYYAKLEGLVKRHLPFDPLKNNSSYMLYKIIDKLYHKDLPVINEIGYYLREVEEEVYSDKNKSATKNLAIIRRNVLNLRRLLEPQLKMVDRLVNMKTSLISERLSVYYDDVHDYLENMWAVLESYRDTLDSLYNSNESLINQKTNEVIKILTIISVALLPMTLVASIYGMNVEGLPFADHPIGLWVIFLLMGAMVGVSIYIAKKNNMI